MINLKSQSEIDNFYETYKSCINNTYTRLTIEGDDVFNLLGLIGIKNLNSLVIKNCSNLESLDGLDSLKYITGPFPPYFPEFNMSAGLIISNNKLLSLNGLNSLKLVSGNILIQNNLQITNFSGLNNLEELIYGGLVITGNDSLKSFDGLNRLTAIPGGEGFQDLNHTIHLRGLEVINNRQLVSFSGLQNLKSIGGNSEIRSNPELSNFEGLDSLTEINGYLEIINNQNLQNFIGLESLEIISGDNFCCDGSRVGYGLIIEENPNLLNFQGLNNLRVIHELRVINNGIENFNGLDSLRKINWFLTIQNNENLKSLSGLESVNEVSNPSYHDANEDVSAVVIVNNPNLTECSLSSICGIIVQYGFDRVRISQNNSNCNEPKICFDTNNLIDLFNINISPNPASKTISISSSYHTFKIDEIYIYNIQGHLVDYINSPNSTTIDVSSYPRGLFFLKISFLNNVVYYKVLLHE